MKRGSVLLVLKGPLILKNILHLSFSDHRKENQFCFSLQTKETFHNEAEVMETNNDGFLIQWTAPTYRHHDPPLNFVYSFLRIFP